MTNTSKSPFNLEANIFDWIIERNHFLIDTRNQHVSLGKRQTQCEKLCVVYLFKLFFITCQLFFFNVEMDTSYQNSLSVIKTTKTKYAWILLVSGGNS